MDPVSVLGVAAAIVQFIQFAQSLISDSNQLYTSSSGLTQQNAHLKEIANSINGLTTGIQRSIAQSTPLGHLSDSDEELNALCSHCGEVAEELLAVLEDLRVQPGENRWRSFQQGLKTIWSKDGIRSLHQRLSRYRKQIEAHITVSLRYGYYLKSPC
jgi:hypothetical protein